MHYQERKKSIRTAEKLGSSAEAISLHYLVAYKGLDSADCVRELHKNQESFLLCNLWLSMVLKNVIMDRIT